MWFVEMINNRNHDVACASLSWTHSLMWRVREPIILTVGCVWFSRIINSTVQGMWFEEMINNRNRSVRVWFVRAIRVLRVIRRR